MIGYVEGKPVASTQDSVTVLTTGGVGYELFLPAPLLARVGGGASEGGETVNYYVSTIVRDNEISLYGFSDTRSKALFELLLKVSGIGPKVGLSILSAFNANDLTAAVANDDIALLGSVPGIGKKTATRLCLELKDRLPKWSGASPATPASGELVSALTNLGFPEKEVFTAIRQIPLENLPLSDQLKQALALLSKR